LLNFGEISQLTIDEKRFKLFAIYKLDTVNMTEDTKKNEIIKLLKSLSFPEWVTNNVLTALGKGIQGIITEAADIPKNKLHNYNERIKLIGELQRELIKKAASHPLKQIENEPGLANRALESLGIKLIEEQLNKETIASMTLEQIKILEVPEKESSNNLSQDWLTAFWNLAGTKSEDEFQEILSKILANEIVSPGNLSLHTLQTLSILDSKVGNTFVRLCNLSIDDGHMAYVIHPNVFVFQNIGILDEYDISLNDLLCLDGANLIRSAETIKLNFKKSETQKDGEYDYEEVDYASLKAKIDLSGKQLNLIYFTQAGKELRRLIDLKPNNKYTESLKILMGENFKIIE